MAEVVLDRRRRSASVRLVDDELNTEFCRVHPDYVGRAAQFALVEL